MHTDRTILNGVTEQIIGSAFTVANTLKCGVAEKVYENAMMHELTKHGLRVEQHVGVTVCYDGVAVDSPNRRPRRVRACLSVLICVHQCVSVMSLPFSWHTHRQM